MLSQEYYEYNHSKIDYKINKYTYKCQKVAFIVGCVIEIANLLDIFIVSKRLMLWGFLAYMAFFLTTAAFCKFVDLHKPWVKYVLILNTVAVVTISGIIFTYHTVLLCVFPLLLAVQYSDKKVLVYTYVLTVISISMVVMVGYYWGLCDANMLTLTTKTTREYMNDAGIVQLTAINDNPWVTLPLYYILPRCLIVFMFVPVIRSISSNVMEYTEYALSMKKLSETDGMTGLYNKNKYLQMLEETYPKVERAAVIFWDVNNLKIINDTLGHIEGDYAITSIAAIIKELTNERRKAYRIGGDEFVMVVENPQENEVNLLVEQYKNALEQKNSFSKFQISAAVGYAVGAGSDIKETAGKADEQMYLEKKEWKSNSKNNM